MKTRPQSSITFSKRKREESKRALSPSPIPEAKVLHNKSIPMHTSKQKAGGSTTHLLSCCCCSFSSFLCNFGRLFLLASCSFCLRSGFFLFSPAFLLFPLLPQYSLPLLLSLRKRQKCSKAVSPICCFLLSNA